LCNCYENGAHFRSVKEGLEHRDEVVQELERRCRAADRDDPV
jgi:hypothetical protein